MKKFCLIFGFMILSLSNYGQTNVPGGFVSGIWTTSGSPYLIQGAIQIPDGSTLTIQPGVSVIFQGAFRFNIQGRLIAIGTKTDTITFTANDLTGGWRGMRFDETPATNDTSRIIYCKLQFAKANNEGGALFFRSFSKAIISNCRISNCSANQGGGIYCVYSDLNITDNIFTNNTASAGAGIFCAYGTTNIINNILSDNHASSSAGGIYCYDNYNYSLNVINNVISNNSADFGGGGIVCDAGTPKIKFLNNIISNNTAGNGGGIYCAYGGGTPTFINNTITNNLAQNGGALLCWDSTNPTFINCILWGNTAISHHGDQVYLNSGYNDSNPNFYFCDIQGGKSAFELDGNFYNGHFENNIDINPPFVAASGGAGTGYNGLVANWSLQSTSSCINSGTPDTTGLNLPLTDIEGKLRFWNGRIDMGAYEFGAPYYEKITICQGDSYNGWTEPGVYQRVYKSFDGSDSTVITKLQVNPSYIIEEKVSICAGQNYKGWNTTGTYNTTFKMKSGCDSTIATKLTVIPISDYTEHKSICQGQNYNGWTTSGTFMRTLQSKSGCDSIITTVLTVNPVYNIRENKAICHGQSYLGWTTAGTYQRTLQSKSGCDSIITTVLTVNPVYNITEIKAICNGQSYLGWSASGTFQRRLQSKTGCDSIVSTVLTVNPVYDITEDKTICQGQDYNGWTTTGKYARTLKSKSGCDSIVTTNLTVVSSYSTTENKSICHGQSYNGWTTSGTYQRKLQSKYACDSIVTTILKVNPLYNIKENTYICQGESYNGWTTTGTYKRTFQSRSGCDSIISTDLTVFPSYHPIIIAHGDTLQAIRQYKTYQWYNESGVIAGATSEKFVISKSGKYHELITDENGCTNISEVISAVYSDVKTSKYEGFRYSIIPNPNAGQFTFRIDSDPEKDLTLKLVNPLGQVIEMRPVQQGGIGHIEQFDVSNLSKGMYYLVILSEWHQTVDKIVVQ